MSRLFLVAVLLQLFQTSLLQAETYELDFKQSPATHYLDRWVYPFNISSGTRIQAPTFGAVGSPGFDDRDGQYLIGLNTEAMGVPVGEPASSYQVESVRLILTEGVGGYRYDPTYDSFRSYLTSDSANFEADDDAGRPIELYGMGLRNDFETLGWPDGLTNTEAPVFSAGTPFGPSDRGTRNVFAADALGNDVSNNIDSLNDGANGYDPTAFAMGQAYTSDGTPLQPGVTVEAHTVIEFEVNLEDAAIRQYVQNGLSAGQLGFVISSLHDSGQQGVGDPFVNLATANHFLVDGPKFELSVTLGDLSLPGDYDASGALDIDDLDLLVAAIADESNDVVFDLTDDALVDTDDLILWVNELYGSYLGDANLDGEFNSGDFVHVFSAGEYEDGLPGNSTWGTGDWNADGEFDSGDFVFAFQGGGYEAGPRELVVAVPEPHDLLTLHLIGLGILAVFGRRSKV